MQSEPQSPPCPIPVFDYHGPIEKLWRFFKLFFPPPHPLSTLGQREHGLRIPRERESAKVILFKYYEPQTPPRLTLEEGKSREEVL